MKISWFPYAIPANSNLVLPNLLTAIKSTDTLVEGDMDADVALIWSILWFGRLSNNKQVWDHFKKHNKPVVVIEVGGLLRNNSWKLALNGINRDADFALDQGYDDKRLKLFNLDNVQHWSNEGDYIVIAGQHGKSEQWKNMPPMDQYFKNIVSEIREKSDKPIVLRSHPRFRENLHFSISDPQWYKNMNCEWNVAKKVYQTYDSFDFEDQLKHTHCLYSYSSNAGVVSIINGVPAVVSEHSLAFDVGSKDVSNLIRPDRYDWLCKMSYSEWFPDEIDQQWKRIRSKL